MRTFAIIMLLILSFIVPLAMITSGVLILCISNITVGQVVAGLLLVMFGMPLLIASIVLTAIGMSV